MGAVWLGEDKLAGRQVAVKELRPPDGLTDEERDVFRKRALQEARSAARLAHPNAVILHDVVPATPADDAVYLVMEYVDGVTLAQLVQQGGPLRPERATGIALQLLSIFEAAHSLGIVHRDIKPSNIMVTASGQVKLTDFGIAHMVGGTRLTGSGVIGTPAYMAPEQIQGQAITPAVDLWALGATLFDVVEGRNPFDRETTVATFHAILMADLPVPACPPPLGTVIAGLLVRAPEQRMTIAHARQLLTAGTGWDSSPAFVAGATGGAGPATHPGNQSRHGTPTYPGPGNTVDHRRTLPGSPAYASGQGHPVTPGTARPLRGRRVALVAGAGGAVVVAAIVAVALTVLHPGPSRTPSVKTSTTGSAQGSGTAVAAPAAATTPATSAGASVSASVSASASASGRVPSAYLGRWQGTLADNIGLEGPQAAQLTITNGAVNSVVGSASYPNVGCTYSLQLSEAQAGKVTLHEEVQSGPCVADWVVLTPDASGLTETVYSVSMSQGRPDFSGHIARAS
jgi:tRNA A-37 threonylcarbamoyl transferase component Bud32